VSIVAINEINEYVKKRESGLPLSEIKRLCAEFVMERDRNARCTCVDFDMEDGRTNRPYAIREGRMIMREKLGEKSVQDL
jgi:hypothetical protein